MTVGRICTAVDVATTVADGVSELLGGDKAYGILGLYLGIGAQDLRRDGYYVVIEPQNGSVRP